MNFFRIATAPLAISLVSVALQTVSAQTSFTYRGICDASAGVPIGPQHFAVADDELNVLRIYRLGEAQPVSSVPVQEFLGTKEKKESDLEGGARIGDRVYWISSHGTNSDGEDQERRKRLFATDIVIREGVPSIEPVGKPFALLIEKLANDKRYDRYGLVAAAKIKPKAPGGLSIEGLAATPDGKLLIGFRNPLSADGALVVTLENPAKVVAGGDPAFSDPIDVKGLGSGRGIRSIERYKDAYLVIAGPTGSDGAFGLFRWSGKASDAAVALTGIALDGLTPEGLFAFPGSDDVVILSDDGEMPVDGKACKKLSDANKKSFRSLTIKP